MGENLVDSRIVEIPSMEVIVPDDPTRRSPSPKSPSPPPTVFPHERHSKDIHEEKEGETDKEKITIERERA